MTTTGIVLWDLNARIIDDLKEIINAIDSLNQAIEHKRLISGPIGFIVDFIYEVRGCFNS